MPGSKAPENMHCVIVVSERWTVWSVLGSMKRCRWAGMRNTAYLRCLKFHVSVVNFWQQSVADGFMQAPHHALLLSRCFQMIIDKGGSGGIRRWSGDEIFSGVRGAWPQSYLLNSLSQLLDRDLLCMKPQTAISSRTALMALESKHRTTPA